MVLVVQTGMLGFCNNPFVKYAFSGRTMDQQEGEDDDRSSRLAIDETIPA